MTRLKVKRGVHPVSLIIAAAGINAALDLNIEADIVITSGNDGEHLSFSKHYANAALDFRSKQLMTWQKTVWIARIQKRLGPQYQVLLEHEGKQNEHVHVEYDPR